MSCGSGVLACVTFVLAKRLKMNVQISPNVLYSLPASLIHSIMTMWIEFSAIFKLDVAVCQHRLRDFHSAFLSSDYFCIDRLMAINQSVGGSDGYHTSADTQRLRWLLARNVKVREFDFACDCQNNDVLNYLRKYGEYVLKLLVSSTSQRITELEGMSILAVARSCPKLRTFSARSLHLGANDDHLKDFLQLCPNIVNLDLQSHFNLTDEALMEALSCLEELHSINLSFCWKLTNITLTFLSERFAHSLQVLHLGENQITQDAINTLRSKCSKLHTYHSVYLCCGGGEDPIQFDQLKFATILTMLYVCNETELVAFASYCQQLQVLDLSQAQQDTSKDNLGALQLMQVGEKCPNLHTIVMSMDPHHQVDYSAVQKAYPKLLFTKDKMRADFDVLAMPV